MWRCTCVPRNVYDFLYPFKPLFRCAQARHFVISVGRVHLLHIAL